MMPKNLTRNVIANGVGRAWALLANMVFVPVYIKLLGSESYGLVVAYATLVATLQVFDAGLSVTLSRELALRSGAQDAANNLPEARDLARTIEAVAACVGLTIGLGVIALAPLLARKWFMTSELSMQQTANAVRLIGLVIAVQWPAIAYQSALLGLHAQVRLNVARVAISSIQAIGAACLLWKVSATIQTYFCWVLVVQAIGTASLRILMWRRLGGVATPPRFRLSLLRQRWRFSAGVAGITLLSAMLTQTDKIVLSKQVSLSMLGIYGVAATVSGVLSIIAGAVYMAGVPQLTTIHARGADAEMLEPYIHSCELVAFLTLPAWMILAFHSRELLALWIGAGEKATAIALLLPLLSTGWLANALDTMPYGLQIACGWTRLSFTKNIVAILLVIPALLFAVPRYGAIGAAAIWCALNVSYLVFEIPIMHKRVLPAAMRPWYSRALLMPVTVAAALGATSRLIKVEADNRALMLAELAVLFIACSILVGVSLPSIRKGIKSKVRLYIPDGSKT